MNLGFLLASRHLLWILLAPPLMAFAECDNEYYSKILNEFCLLQFQFKMEDLGAKLWCDWKATEEGPPFHYPLKYLRIPLLSCPPLEQQRIILLPRSVSESRVQIRN
ncbi:receptor activity-modifying protein 1 isoform X2 [Eleutherodactylus coqui]|uniref:receptor activity-modifying protein 1 isoform X2 n=1 Tax=Eleutherodactylus coqui TaxID=57060 RepID=UPI003462866E